MTKHLLGIWCVVAAAGCGGGGGSIAVDDLFPELIDVQCDTAVECGQAESDAACRAAIDVGGGDFDSILAAVDGGTIKYDADKAGECIDAFADQSCEFAGFHGRDNSACEDVFAGTVALGGACMISEECAGDGRCSPTDTSCDPETACCPGTCMAGPGTAESQEGGPCNDDVHVCDVSLYCSAASSDVPGTCAQPIAGEGSACTDVDSCANPMYCDVFSDTPTCVRPPSTGETCDPQALLVCADSRDYCDATMKCARAGDAGAACTGGDACLSYASCINGACVAQGGPGATCGGASDPDCAGDLDCTNGTCALPPASPTCSL